MELSVKKIADLKASLNRLLLHIEELEAGKTYAVNLAKTNQTLTNHIPV